MSDALGAARVPARYVQLDSWWYEKAADEGLASWTPMPEVFPDGMSRGWTRGAPQPSHRHGDGPLR